MESFSFTSKIESLKSSVWSLGVIIPQEISNAFIQLHGKRCICSFNNTIESHVALMPKGENTYFININKDLQKKLKASEGNNINLTIRKDTSTYQMDVPEELTEVWNQDEEGKTVFHTLTPGKQRSLIHLIAKPKSSDIRIHKSLTIINYLKNTGGKLDFKELNEAFKIKH